MAKAVLCDDLPRSPVWMNGLSRVDPVKVRVDQSPCAVHSTTCGDGLLEPRDVECFYRHLTFSDNSTGRLGVCML